MTPRDRSHSTTSPGHADGPRPDGLAAELRWVHDMLRRDLVGVRALAVSVADGASTERVEAALADLESNGPLFQLRVSCLSYCQTVHAHHTNEDVLVFPAVRQALPRLGAAVDRLEADHRLVAELLDQVERHASDLSFPSHRTSLVDALTMLSTHLLEHLEYEETVLGPVLDSWDGSLPPALAAARRDRFTSDATAERPA